MLICVLLLCRRHKLLILDDAKEHDKILKLHDDILVQNRLCNVNFVYE